MLVLRAGGGGVPVRTVPVCLTIARERHSCFTAEEVTWASHPGESHCMSHHVVVDRAAIDNRHESEHLPLCPWYERVDTRKTW